MNLRAYQATTPDGVVDLKEKEAMILRLLREHAGEPVDRETILDRVWGFGAYPTTRTVDNFILALRKLVEEDPRNAPAHPDGARRGLPPGAGAPGQPGAAGGMSVSGDLAALLERRDRGPAVDAAAVLAAAEARLVAGADLGAERGPVVPVPGHRPATPTS